METRIRGERIVSREAWVRVAPELSGQVGGVANARLQIEVTLTRWRKSRKRFEVGVADNHDVDARLRRYLQCVLHTFLRLNHHDDEHIVVDRRTEGLRLLDNRIPDA